MTRIHRAHAPHQGLSLAMLSAYPPTLTPLTNFAVGLERELSRLGHEVTVVRATPRPLESDCGRRVAGTLLAGSPRAIRHAAEVLSRADVAVVLHDDGIYGGRDGEEILDVVRLVEAPLVTVLHSPPAQPRPNQRRIIVELCRRSAEIVVATESARIRLDNIYGIEPWRVSVIPHGTLIADDPLSPRIRSGRGRPRLLSWGFLAPRKGIESAIDAVAALRVRGQHVRYTITGRTDPIEVDRHGERYRGALRLRARMRDVPHLVRFDESYRGPEHLSFYLASSLAIVLPYASRDDVASGVLVESLAAGRPVIATAFPHAEEVLSDGAGILVRHDDPEALAEAMAAVTQDDALRSSMVERARDVAQRHAWPLVAREYEAASFRATHRPVAVSA